MSVSRRHLLQGALYAASTAVAARGAVAVRSVVAAKFATRTARAHDAAHAIAADVTLLITDSRVAASRQLADRHKLPALDVVAESAQCWRGLRRQHIAGAVVGLTTWSDWVQVRGFLQERGLRMRLEQRRGAHFYWEMA